MVIDSMRHSHFRPTETFQVLPTREFRAIMATDPNHVATKDD
jgi:hypothetical protein